ncbi:MAG: kinase [Magnetococcales bacterium]|nr:kinase [Magnetococcales bacterium]
MTNSGQMVEYRNEIVRQGGMKDAYFSCDRSQVVLFFRDPLSRAGIERLEAIIGPYREGIFHNNGGDYWKDLFCWPTGMVQKDGRHGVVVPVYQSQFFFTYGSVNNDFLGIRGKEKEGKWFASASNRNKFLAPEERGNWLTHLQICLMISRAVRRLHMAGLAHSDLSYKNVLVDPTSGKACVIDIDGLVVPQKFLPDVVGTPDFIAPEVLATQHLERSDPARRLPSIATDRHALAVLIYMYLFYRHPLRGGKVHDMDATRDEELTMGSGALFIEHPNDRSNLVKANQLSTAHLPWGDPARIPFTIAGPLLKKLFLNAFVDGLHNPDRRPSASEWENALVRTIDMIQPCPNQCEMGWYVFDNSTRPKCPFCGTAYTGALPVLNFYSSRHQGEFLPDDHRLMVWDGQSLFLWHVTRRVFPNEHLASDQRLRMGYFRHHRGEWYLVNERMNEMLDMASGRRISIGSNVRLSEGSQFLLSRDDGGRLVHVQLVNG